jgi:hypothetical protein
LPASSTKGRFSKNRFEATVMKRIIEKRGPRKNLIHNEKGQALIFITLAFIVLGMFIGLAVDGGRAYLMRERLRKIVDAASLAGAKAMAGVAEGSDILAAVKNAACESAMINGLSPADCGTDKLTIEVGDVPNPPIPGWPTQKGVIVTGEDTGRTFFMALGGLIGCDSCTSINVVARGQAAPDTLVDVVLVLDDSGTMSTLPGGTPCVTFTEPGCPINGAKQGAITLVNMLLADPSSHAKIAFVPFRGCYAAGRNLPTYPYFSDPTGRQGCIITNTEILPLTNDASALTAAINDRRGAGGFPGTNVCLGMHEGKKKLAEGRAIARKVMVVLTDGDQTYSDHAWGGGGDPTLNLANPVPTPYPQTPYQVGVGDGGNDATPGSCMSPTPAGDASSTPPNPQYNSAINSLDGLANAKATTLKQTDPSGVNVEIYVLRFASPPGDSLASGDPPGSCDPSIVGAPGIDRDNSNEIRDRNLSRCLASDNDHYFYAATAADISTQFTAIATSILKKRRLVG